MRQPVPDRSPWPRPLKELDAPPSGACTLAKKCAYARLPKAHYYLESFVDPERFRGTCYRAAGWHFLGLTTGRGKDSQSKRANRSLKEVLGYPLIPDFRQRLGEVGP
jgi:hypothetical protein